jgi:hypothetical protein
MAWSGGRCGRGIRPCLEQAGRRYTRRLYRVRISEVLENTRLKKIYKKSEDPQLVFPGLPAIFQFQKSLKRKE